MPFDMAPQETEVREFQDVADTILRGCAITEPEYLDAARRRHGRVYAACVWMAFHVGKDGPHTSCQDSRKFWAAADAYKTHYGSEVIPDFEHRLYSREQIAARIAAL